ncbi:MAG: 16S rRNA (guanine(966)-N(2))-methyltransferase RsmD [Solirubrobacterales bacterium]|nr:16S rRNA (guanine(966)-N(2))-methyltransferase RsmD [Solirubrobacterales bacterium]
MRVIAGRWGGRELRAPAGRNTRPTAARVREALFAMLEPLEGATVLDLFAGTGALGIEALSRGAARAVFVERDGGAVRALRGNLSALGVGGEEARVRRQDVAVALGAARRAGETYDLVLIDPPYRGARAGAGALEQALIPLLAPGARVAVESDRRDPLTLALEVVRERRYGDTSITIHRHQ